MCLVASAPLECVGLAGVPHQRPVAVAVQTLALVTGVTGSVRSLISVLLTTSVLAAATGEYGQDVVVLAVRTWLRETVTPMVMVESRWIAAVIRTRSRILVPVAASGAFNAVGEAPVFMTVVIVPDGQVPVDSSQVVLHLSTAAELLVVVAVKVSPVRESVPVLTTLKYCRSVPAAVNVSASAPVPKGAAPAVVATALHCPEPAA